MGFCEMKLTCLGILLSVLAGKASSTITNLTATHVPATFTSQNYPKNYPNSTVSYWLIKAEDKNAKIYIEVIDSMVEYDDKCLHDYVKVYDGPHDSYPRIGMFCGDSLPDYQSTRQAIFIKFKSDSSKQYKGFKIRYYTVSPESKELPFSTKAVICTVLGLLCTFLLFVMGNYFLRTARKSGRGATERMRSRATSVLYSITNSGQTIVSVENGTRITRTSSGTIIRDESSETEAPPTLPSNLTMPSNLAATNRNASAMNLCESASGFSMVLNVQGLRLQPPSYDSLERYDRELTANIIGEPPPAYDSLDLGETNEQCESG